MARCRAWASSPPGRSLQGFTGTRTRVPPLCEAICGLELTLQEGRVTSIRGNAADPLSRGHICPKGVALADVYEDPDGSAIRSGGSAPAPTRNGSGSGGTRRSTGSPTGWPAPSTPTAGTRWASTWAIPTPTRSGPPHTVCRWSSRWAPATGSAPPPWTRSPTSSSAGSSTGTSSAADPRHRPDVVLPRRGRQPDGVERLADDRAGLPRPRAGAEEARRTDGRARPTPHRDREGSHRAPLRPARLRCRGPAGDAARVVRGAATTPRRTSTESPTSRRSSPSSPRRWPNR